MDASMWVAKTGLTAQSTRMTVIANNLATLIPLALRKIEPILDPCINE